MSRPAATSRWSGLLEGAGRERLAARLIADARPRRWFRGKSRAVSGARVADAVPLDGDSIDAAANLLVVLEVRYAEGEPDLYVLPLAWSAPDAVRSLRERQPHALIGAQNGLDDGLVDGLATGTAAAALFELVQAGGTRRGERGALSAERSELFGRLIPAAGAAALGLRVAGVEQTNSTVMFGDRALLKVYRQLTAGPNPELELGRFLERACEPPCVPRVLGALTYSLDGAPPRSLGIIHELIPNHGDAWALAERELARFFAQPPDAPAGAGRFAAHAARLGRRTGELHLALAGRARPVPDAGPDFAPEPLTDADRRALAERTEAMLGATLAALGRSGRSSPAIQRLLSPEGRQAIARVLSEFRQGPLEAGKTRTHGDLHLGQVLAVSRSGGAGDDDAAVDDFVIIDFEGEPARPLHERRAKGSPLRDVMGMVRSFDYAPEAALRTGGGRGDGQGRRARAWTREVTASYLDAYLETTAGAPFLPRERGQLTRLLEYYELEKVVYEVEYELNNRPDWLDIPLRGLLAVAGLESGT